MRATRARLSEPLTPSIPDGANSLRDLDLCQGAEGNAGALAAWLASMSAEADAVCGAGYGERTPERVHQRTGYRHRAFDTGAGGVSTGG